MKCLTSIGSSLFLEHVGRGHSYLYLLIVCLLMPYSFIFKAQGRQLVREEIKVIFCLHRNTTCTCWLKACSRQKESGLRVIQSRDSVCEQAKISLVSSCDLPSLWGTGWDQGSRDGTQLPGDREELGIQQYLEGKSVIQELSASSGRNAQCQAIRRGMEKA